jgi:hypothetical protein
MRFLTLPTPVMIGKTSCAVPGPITPNAAHTTNDKGAWARMSDGTGQTAGNSKISSSIPVKVTRDARPSQLLRELSQ